MSSIQETVAVLEAFELEDDLPNIEAPSPALSLDGETQTNYIDRSAFDTKWVDETTAMSRLRDTLEQGKQFVTMVYTYRGCSKALPQVKGESDPNKAEIHEKTFEVLEPEIQKLKSFRHFQIESVKLFCEMVRKIVAEKRDVVSEGFLLYLAKLLDLFALLDALKNMKACLNNDFSFYKRAFGFLRKNMASEDQTAENHQLSLFLANQNAITTAFKTELQQIQGFDDVISMIVNLCASCMEEERFVLPAEKNALLRVMPYGLFLMDGESPNSPLNVFKSKKVNLSRFSKLFKRFPVVPLYGDMQITLEALIKRSSHFDAKAWEVPEPAKSAVEYEIIHQMRDAREQAKQYLARYSTMMSEIRLLQKANQPIAPLAERATNAVRDGIFFMCDWSGKVLAQAAWKYAHPAGLQPLPDGTMPPPSLNDERVYERVVKNNYSTEERFALVEILAIIKSISGVLLKDDGILAPLIRRCVHDEVQAFIQIRLREMIRNAAKKKRAVRGELMQLRALASDWAAGVEPNDPALLGQKATKDEKPPPIPSRAVPPSATQLELIRSMVYSFFAWKMLGKKGPYSDKDFDDDDIKILKDFYNRSFFYSYLLNYPGTITEATDLADLWYREFYLELSKRLQFPIDMSLPWVLTDNILETHYSAMMEYLLYPLDIYNDAANRALNILHCQFLYDEIEAEVNLAFDQLVYKLCEQIFAHYKQQASSVLLDKPYKALAELCYPDAKAQFHPQKSRYEPLMRQRHVQLLGRSIDLNALIAKRMNQFLRQNVDYAISRFEAADLTSIIELEVELKNIRFTHGLLSKYFELDAWDYIFNEVNESTSLVSFHGRVVLHVIFELVYDLFPAWNYNSITGRFHKTILSFADDVQREPMPKAKLQFLFGSKTLNYAYGQASQLFAKFFGMPHLHALIRVVGKANLALVIGECLHNVELKINNVLAPYVRELNKAMPPSSKLPLFDYKTTGCFGYFQLKLKDITVYPDLRSEVFQHFKEMGNTVIFMNMLDHAAAAHDTSSYVQAAPFLGITPDTWSAVAREKATGADPSLTAPLYARISEFAASVAAKPGACRAPEQLNDLTTSAWRADKFYRLGDQHISLFKAAMQKLYDILGNVRHEWAPVGGGDSGVIPIDSTTEFYRFWSAVQFVFCLPTGANELSPQELFGDGLAWSGITIIHLLQQGSRFDLFDFSYYIMNVEDASDEPTPATDKNKLPDFFKKVTIARELNTQIFEILRSYYELTNTQFATFEPPAADADLSATHTMSMTLRSEPPPNIPLPTAGSTSSVASTGSEPTLARPDGAPPSLTTPTTLRKPPALGEPKGRALPSPTSASENKPKPEASPIRPRPAPPDQSSKPTMTPAVPDAKPKPAVVAGSRPQPTVPARKGGPLSIGARPTPAAGDTMQRNAGPETLPARGSGAGTMSRGSGAGTVSRTSEAGAEEIPPPPAVDALPPPPSRDALPPPPSRAALPPPPARDALPPPPMRDALPPPPAAPARDALPAPPARPAVKPPPRDGLPPPPAPPRP